MLLTSALPLSYLAINGQLTASARIITVNDEVRKFSFSYDPLVDYWFLRPVFREK